MKKFLLSITCAVVLLIGAIFPVTVTFTQADSDTYVNNTVKDTYRLDTGIIGYATVTAFINDVADLNEIKGLRYDADKAPATVYLYTRSVDGELYVTTDGGEVITFLTDVLNNYTRNKIIPAFYLTENDYDTAADLQAYLLEHDIKDAFVVSADAATLTACTHYRNAAGALVRLRAASMLEFADCKNLTWREINEKCSAAGARACLIDFNDKTAEEFEEFYSNSVYSAMTAYIRVDTVEEMQSAVLGGAFAVVYDEWKQTIDFIESFDSATLVHDLIIQGHRGVDVLYQENTLEGIVVAAQAGFDTIEIDPRLTKDKQIVLMHDDNITRATGGLSGYVKDYTLAQLKSLSVIVNSSADPAPICSLEDVFVVYKKYGFTTMLALDAKETNEEYYQILYDLIEEYDMWDCIETIGIADSSDYDIAKNLFNDRISFVKVGSKNVGGKSCWQEDIINWTEVLASADRAYGAVNYYYTNVIKSASSSARPETVRAANDRAIKLRPYQFDTVEYLEELFYLQVDVISSGMGTYLSDFIECFNVSDVSRNVKAGDVVSITGETVTVNGQTAQAVATSYKVLGGDGEALKQSGNSIKAVKDGTVKIIAAVTYKKGNIEYNIYSGPITVTVNGAVDKGESKGCGAGITCGLNIPVVMLACLVILKRKGVKTDEK